MNVALIILNWNGKKDTLDCLESVSKLQVNNYNLQIIVVDNGSTDGSLEEIRNSKSKIQNLHIIGNEQNLGFSEGNNVGIRYAMDRGANYLVLLNNDTLVEQNLINELLEVMEQNKEIGIASPKIYFAPGFEYYHDKYKENERGKIIWYAGGNMDWKNILPSHRGVDEVDHGQYEYDQISETDFSTGCCMIIRREVLDKIGLLNSKYFMYFEDMDFCERAKMVGFKVFYIPQGFLWHKNASSSNKPGSKLHQYYQTRNRLLFGMKYANTRAKFALFRESIKFLMFDEVKRSAVMDFYLRKFGAKND